jgi:hypothetical protein
VQRRDLRERLVVTPLLVLLLPGRGTKKITKKKKSKNCEKASRRRRPSLFAQYAASGEWDADRPFLGFDFPHARLV